MACKNKKYKLDYKRCEISLTVKNSAALFKMASVKSCEIKGVAKKWL